MTAVLQGDPCMMGILAACLQRHCEAWMRSNKTQLLYTPASSSRVAYCAATEPLSANRQMPEQACQARQLRICD
jgi:hypothetical protein